VWALVARDAPRVGGRRTRTQPVRCVGRRRHRPARATRGGFPRGGVDREPDDRWHLARTGARGRNRRRAVRRPRYRDSEGEPEIERRRERRPRRIYYTEIRRLLRAQTVLRVSV